MMVPPASARTFIAVGYFPSYPRLHPSFRGTEPCPCIKLKNVAQTPKIREQLSLTTISDSGNHFARFHDSQSPDIPFESIGFLFRHRLTNHPMPQEPDATRSGNEAAVTGMKTAVTGMKWSPRLFVVTPVVYGAMDTEGNGYRSSNYPFSLGNGFMKMESLTPKQRPQNHRFHVSNALSCSEAHLALIQVFSAWAKPPLMPCTTFSLPVFPSCFRSPKKRIRPDKRVAGRIEWPACKINMQGKDTSQPNSSQEILPI